LLQAHRVLLNNVDCTIKLWDLETGNLLNSITGHTDLVRTLQFNPKFIVSGGYDEHVNLWDTNSAKLIHSFHMHRQRVYKVEFNDTMIVSCSQDQNIVIYDFSAGVDTSFF
jgi:WD40 repeat protein